MEFPGNAGKTKACVGKLLELDDESVSSSKQPNLSSSGDSSWIERSFSKMNEGSLRGTMLNFIVQTIEPGIVVVPYVLKMVGLGLGIIVILGGMLASLYSFKMLLSVSALSKEQDYGQLCKAKGGETSQKIYLLTLAIQIFGSIVVLQVANANLLMEIAKTLGFELVNYYLWIIIPSIVIYAPLCRILKTSAMYYMSLFSVINMIFISLVYISQAYSNWTAEMFSQIVWFKFDYSFFRACGITFMSFLCHDSFFPIIYGLKDPTSSRMNTVVYRGIGVVLFFYIFVSIPAYLTYFDQLNPLVLSNNPINGVFAVLLFISRIGIVLLFTSSFPMLLFPIKDSLLILANGTKGELPEPLNTIFVCLCLAASSIIAMIIPSIEDVFSILGGVTSVILAFILPSFLYIKSFKKLVCKSKIKATIFFCVFMAYVGSLSFTATVLPC